MAALGAVLGSTIASLGAALFSIIAALGSTIASLGDGADVAAGVVQAAARVASAVKALTAARVRRDARRDVMWATPARSWVASVAAGRDADMTFM